MEAERCKRKPCVGSRALQEKAMRWKLSVALEAAMESHALEAARESHALEAERCVGSCQGKPCVGS